MKEHIKRILKDSEARVRRSLRIQVLDERSPDYGGFREETGLVQPKFAIYRLTTMAAAYFYQGSCFFHDGAVRERIELALRFVQRMQHENGLFDLFACNFSSAPDTAFCVKRLLPLLQYAEAHLEDPFAAFLRPVLRDIIRRGALGICEGGFHTPNHRWAIAACLLECHALFSDGKMRACAMKYLNEGIDCNGDGEFAERSAGNYNRINNDAMMAISNILGQEQYDQYAIRNLRMMLYYIEPDGTIFTNNSTRQDRGQKITLKDYYFQYLSLGFRYEIAEFLDVANFIFEAIQQKGLRAPDCLLQMMNHPEMAGLEHEGAKIPVRYKKYFRDSGIVRVRRGDMSYSLVNRCPSFFFFQKGGLSVGMKIGASYFEHRSFVPDSLIQLQDGYQLLQNMDGWYYLPLEEPAGTTDWWSMDHSKRGKVSGPSLRLCVRIEEQPDGVDVHIRAQGVENAPLRIELSFDSGTLVRSDSFALPGDAGGFVIAGSGDVAVSKGDDALVVGPAFAAHRFVSGNFGSQARDTQRFTVYFTDNTSFERTFSIRACESDC